MYVVPCVWLAGACDITMMRRLHTLRSMPCLHAWYPAGQRYHASSFKSLQLCRRSISHGRSPGQERSIWPHRLSRGCSPLCGQHGQRFSGRMSGQCVRRRHCEFGVDGALSHPTLNHLCMIMLEQLTLSATGLQLASFSEPAAKSVCITWSRAALLLLLTMFATTMWLAALTA